MKSFIPASENGFPDQWKFISFVQKFSYLVETITEISESQFLRKDGILTDVTNFLASRNQVLPFSQTVVNCCQWKQSLLQLKHIFQPIINSGQWKQVFSLLETVFCYSEFFSASGERFFSPIFRNSYQSRKSFILASGNGFRVNNGFHRQKKKP